jgi:Ricin-type beta-trefoil lectin domain
MNIIALLLSLFFCMALAALQVERPASRPIVYLNIQSQHLSNPYDYCLNAGSPTGGLIIKRCGSLDAEYFEYDPHTLEFKPYYDSTKCLEVEGGVALDLKPIVLRPCSGAMSQKFVIDNQQIKSYLDTTKCLDVAKSNFNDGTIVRL